MFAILIAFGNDLYSQVLEFKDVTPTWSYTLEEKSSVDTTHLIDIFNIVERDGKYIIIGASKEPYYGDWYGATVTSLDQNGNEEWYTSYQTFANNDSIHVFFPNVVNPAFTSSEIQLFGYRRKHEWTDTPDRGDQWSLYGAEEMYPHDIKINLQTGTIADVCVGNDTITIETSYNYLSTFKNEAGEILKTTTDVYPRPDSSFFGKNNLTLGFSFYDYNNLCSFSRKNILDSILFLPNDTVGSLSIELFPIRIQPDPNTLLANIWFERYSNEPRQYLMWMDISDFPDFKLIEMQELNRHIPNSTDRAIFFRFETKNKQILLSHSYNYGREKASYLLWLNSEQQVKKAIAPCQIDGHFYSSMDLVHATDGELLCLGFPSRAPNRGYDLVRVTADEDSLIFVKSIVPKEDNIYYNFHAGTVSESGEELILGVYVFQYENNRIFNERQEIHAFRLSELTNTSYRPRDTNRHLYIYPNPASSYVIFKHPINIKKAILHNISGKQMPLNYQEGKDKIDISQLPPGLYLLQTQDFDGNWYQTKLIKQ